MAAEGGMPEHICDREPASPAPCPLRVHAVWTDGSYSKTPQATEAISKRPVKPSTESEKEWERGTKKYWKAFHFSITMATYQKPQEALLDFKLSVTSKSNSASWSVWNWIDLLLIVSSFGIPVFSGVIYFAEVILYTLLQYIPYTSGCHQTANPINEKAIWEYDVLLSTSIPSHKLISHLMSNHTIKSAVLPGTQSNVVNWAC